MERLISLREFIVEPKHWKDTEHFDNHDVLSLIISYANFLSQPLTLSMFAPCDEEGNVLEEPNRSTHTNEECETYKAAKERVLFEGVDLDAAKHHISQNRTVEYLAQFGTVSLTLAAKKQIFG